MARKRTTTDSPPLFAGFDRPESNWFRMPNSWTDITADITSIAELKVTEYILRHTWGYQEYGIKKHITIDEFVNGRRRQDGTRMDRGTGLSERAVYDGLRKAVARGLVEEEIDDSDRGRVKKYYRLKMREASSDGPASEPLHDLQPGVQSLQGGVQDSQARGANSIDRTEKDTQERHFSSRSFSNTRKNTADVDNSASVSPAAEHPSRSRRGEVENLGTVLERRRGRPRQVPHQDEDYQTIQAYIADFRRELNDQASLKSSTMRAYNLYQRSELPLETFINQLFASRSIVKERTGSIRSQAGTDAYGVPLKNKAAYYFEVLQDLLGFRDDPPDPSAQK
jgi:hypothetical protein